MTPREEQLRAEICEVGRRVYARGYVASNDGNISVRLDDQHLLATPKNVSKGFMTPDMMVVTDMQGRKVAGHRDASTELKMHLAVYEMRPDIRAVVHAHPPLSTGFAVAGVPLNKSSLAEIIFSLGSVPIAEYATPSTQELPDAVKKYITRPRWPAAGQPRRADGRPGPDERVFQDGDDGAFRADHAGCATARGREPHFPRGSEPAPGPARLLRHQVAGAHLHRPGHWPRAPGTTCQFVDAPASDGPRIVPPMGALPGAGEGGEIRLTYRELAALIADAVRQVTRDA